MQALSPQQYQWLERLAQAYLRRHAHEYKTAPGRNPHLAVDALCFQRHDGAMLGALVTPLSLSLALVPWEALDGAQPDDDSQNAARGNGARRDAAQRSAARRDAAHRIVRLPSGRYPFVREVLDGGEVLWRCELLDDLSTLSGPEDASRLAQQLMQRVMAPAEAGESGAAPS